MSGKCLSSGIPPRSLVGPAAKSANDPHDIADSDHTGDQPQECAGSGIECQADAEAQCEDQEGGSEDSHVQDDSDGSSPRCHFLADLSLMAAVAAADCCVFPSINLCLSPPWRTCGSVINLAPPGYQTIVSTDRQEWLSSPARMIVAVHPSNREPQVRPGCCRSFRV